jgi:hypothetical protein
MVISTPSEIRGVTSEESLTNAALPALLGAVLAILAILAGMARIGTCASRCGSAQGYLAEEKNPQHGVSQNDKQS